MVEFEHRIDPELRIVIRQMPDRDLEDLPGQRLKSDEMLKAMRAGIASSDFVRKEDYLIPGRAMDPMVRVRIYRPSAQLAEIGCLVWIHGGGYVAGSIVQDEPICECIVESVGCAVVSVDYRLAPENPFPAAAEDCYAALRWASQNADHLGLIADRFAIGGASSGAGAAAAVALMVRDRGELDLLFQLLDYPMLDDRAPVTPTQMVTYPKVWNLAANELSWRSYLGSAYGTDDVSPYAAPARAADLTGLPPSFIGVGQLDLFVEEDIAYAQRLISAGVPTELHVYPGATHGFDILVPTAEVSRRFVRDRNDALRRVLQQRTQ
jgi:acetyl esterase/lipase